MNNKLLVLPLALLAAGAVACGGDGSKQLDGWAGTVCQASRSPIAQAETALRDIGSVRTGEGPQDLRQRLSGDIGTLATANDRIAAALDKAGAPQVTDGPKLQKSAVDELRKAARGYRDVQAKVNALSTADQARFADGLKGVGDQVQQLAELSNTALDKLQSGQVGAAIAKQPGCRRGTASASGAPAGGSAGGSSAPAGAASGTSGGGGAASPRTPSGARSAAPSASKG